MIEAELLFDREGLLKRCKIVGHAKKKDSVSLCCATVSLLSKTAGTLLHESKGVLLETDVQHEGAFLFSILEFSEEVREFCLTVGIFLERGLRLAQEEFEDEIHLTLLRE